MLRRLGLGTHEALHLVVQVADYAMPRCSYPGGPDMGWLEQVKSDAQARLRGICPRRAIRQESDQGNASATACLAATRPA